MNRNGALKILSELGNSPNMVKHALACEAAMRALARKLITQNSELKTVEDEWGIVGLLHDADYEATDKLLERHTDLVTEKLQALRTKQEIIDAIRGHCDKAPRETAAAKAIYAADELTGLIVATALVMPDPTSPELRGAGKKLSQVTVKSILKKFKDKSFAKGANREQIKTCETELNIPLPEFCQIVLKSMQEISNDLGL